MAPLAEVADLPGLGIGGWNGLMGPAGLPRPIAERLTAEMRGAMDDPVLRVRLEQIGLEPAPLGPEAFLALLREQRDILQPPVRRLGIRAE